MASESIGTASSFTNAGTTARSSLGAGTGKYSGRAESFLATQSLGSPNQPHFRVSHPGVFLTQKLRSFPWINLQSRVSMLEYVDPREGWCRRTVQDLPPQTLLALDQIRFLKLATGPSLCRVADYFSGTKAENVKSSSQGSPNRQGIVSSQEYHFDSGSSFHLEM